MAEERRLRQTDSDERVVRNDGVGFEYGMRHRLEHDDKEWRSRVHDAEWYDEYGTGRMKDSEKERTVEWEHLCEEIPP